LKKLHDEEAKYDWPTVAKCKEKIMGREKTLISGSVYYVMNITYIHMRTEDPNIYIYIYICIGRGKYTKNPLEKYTIIENLLHI
jgi:hypothetical protein